MIVEVEKIIVKKDKKGNDFALQTFNFTAVVITIPFEIIIMFNLGSLPSNDE